MIADIPRMCGHCGGELTRVPKPSARCLNYFYCITCDHFFRHDEALRNYLLTNKPPKWARDWYAERRQKG